MGKDRDRRPSDFSSEHLYKFTQEFAIAQDQTKRAELATQIAIVATEETTYGQPILWTIDRVTKRGRQQGALVLDKIAEYFEKNEIVFKIPMQPGGKNTTKGLEQFKRDLEGAEEGIATFSKNKYLTDKHGKTLRAITTEMRAYWDTSAKGKYPEVLTTARLLSVDTEDLLLWQRLQIEDSYLKLANVLTNYRNQYKSEARQPNNYVNEVGVPAVFIPALENFSNEIRAKLLPKFDIYRKKFSGISLQDLVKDRFSGDNYEESLTQARRINTYLGSIPKGDPLWHAVVDNMFLHPFLFALPAAWDATPQEAFGRPDWFAKVLAFHEYLGNQVYLPEINKFYDRPLPPNFHQEDIESAIHFLQAASPHLTSGVAYFGISYPISSKRIFHPTENINSLAARSPFYLAARDIVGLQTQPEMAISVLEPLMPQLEQSRGKEFVDWARHLLKIDKYKESQMEWLKDWCEDRFGENFLDELRKNSPGIVDVTARIINGSYQLSASRWGEVGADIEIEMSDESLARKLGIVASIWEFPSEQSKDIQFVLRSEHPALELSGTVNLSDQEIRLRYLEYEDDWTFFSDTMKLVAAATLHDILGRNQTLWERDKRVNSESKRWPIVVFPKAKPLPRKWFMLKSKDLIEGFIHPTGGIEKVDIEPSKSKSPKYVNAHVRRVPYGAVIEALVNKYNHEPNLSEEQKATLLLNIRNLRDGTDPKGRMLGKPDRAKFEKLPLAFQKELHPIIDPDGYALYTRTFVGPHFNPGISIADYENMISLYNATYVTSGSALAFLESAIAELSGMEHN